MARSKKKNQPKPLIIVPYLKALLKEVKDSKIDGIIAWLAPDRLARNMVEAGKIIDMLDKGQMKDLRFHSHQFDNSSNGKMMLGMLFVFAKHYSDDLSDRSNEVLEKEQRKAYLAVCQKTRLYSETGCLYAR